MIKQIPVLIVVIPLLFALVIPLISKIKTEYSWFLSSISTLMSFVFSIILLKEVFVSGKISYWLGGWEPPWGIEYLIDPLNVFVLVVVSFIISMVALYALKSVESEIPEKRIPFFYALYLLFSAGLMGIVITGDLFNMYVFLEIMSISGYALIAAGKKREALYASYKYLILGTIGATLILLGIGHLYMVTGTLNIADIAQRLPSFHDSKVVLIAFAFMAAGLSLKVALFPLHTWLPRSYTNAPSAVSAIMAATATKVSAYVFIRVIFSVFGLEFMTTQAFQLVNVFIVLSAIAILAGSILAVAQTDIKKLLAYSSIGQIGYIVLGIFLLNKLGVQSSLLHILNHALMKGTLFLVVGSVVYKTGITTIKDFKGMGKKMPFSMVAFTIGALSMIGVPLTVGFVSKWYLALASLDAGMWYLIPIILISSLLMAVYFWRIIDYIYFKEEHEGHHGEHEEEVHTQEAPAGMVLPSFFTAGLCVVFGVLAFIPVSIVEKAAVFLMK